MRTLKHRTALKQLKNLVRRKKIELIEKKEKALQELLKTPLLITLLLISYNHNGELPKHFADFYDKLFHALLRRHDLLKKQFERQTLCPISDDQFRELFDRLCYFSKKKARNSFEKADLIEYINKAKEQDASVIVFPEMTIPGYLSMDLFQNQKYADPVSIRKQVLQNFRTSF